MKRQRRLWMRITTATEALYSKTFSIFIFCSIWQNHELQRMAWVPAQGHGGVGDNLGSGIVDGFPRLYCFRRCQWTIGSVNSALRCNCMYKIECPKSVGNECEFHFHRSNDTATARRRTSIPLIRTKTINGAAASVHSHWKAHVKCSIRGPICAPDTFASFPPTAITQKTLYMWPAVMPSEPSWVHKASWPVLCHRWRLWIHCHSCGSPFRSKRYPETEIM